MSNDQVRVLVLGGNRYIGLSLVRELARTGFTVTVANSHEAALPGGVERIHVDRRRPGDLRDALMPHARRFDVVFDNTAYVVSDIEPLVDLFDGHIQHYVFTSSVAVYRRSFIQPITEKFRVHETVGDQPLRAYAVGKVECERFLAERFRHDGFPATAVRVTHTVGPRSPLVTREPGLFARLELGRPILIPGEGFPFVHLVHIDDVARMMVAVIGNDRASGEVYNVGGEEVTSIVGCIHLMARAAGLEPNIVPVPVSVARGLGRPLVHWGEATNGGTIFSIAKAVDHLAWTPGVGLEEAYRDSYAWYATEGRDNYEYDFSFDDEVLSRLNEGTRRSSP
jgi:nucleoside-diphosphate-sugar epimerase